MIFCAFCDIINNIAVNGDCFCFLKKRENEMRRKNVGSEKGKKAPSGFDLLSNAVNLNKFKNNNDN